MVGTFLEPSRGRRLKPIHSIPYSVAQPLERGSNNYYSIIQGIELEKNDTQMLPLFRNWNDFDYHIDLSTCTNIANGLQNATLTIRAPKSKKIVWTLSI